MIPVLVLLAIAAFVLTIASAMGKVALWVPMLLVCVWMLLYSLPLGR